MKKSAIFNSTIALFAFLTLTMCTKDDKPLQFTVGGDLDQTVEFNDVTDQTELSESGTIDLTDLININDKLIETNIDKITLTLNEDYSGESISLNLNLTVGDGVIVLENYAVTLVKGEPLEINLTNAINIFNSLSSNKTFDYTFEGTTTPILDDMFSINVSFGLKAKIEL